MAFPSLKRLRKQEDIKFWRRNFKMKHIFKKIHPELNKSKNRFGLINIYRITNKVLLLTSIQKVINQTLTSKVRDLCQRVAHIIGISYPKKH